MRKLIQGITEVTLPAVALPAVASAKAGKD
jgi:hypothetical protein